MQNTIEKIKNLHSVLHIDLLCNAGPYWVRQIAGMSEHYIFLDANFTLEQGLNNALQMKPDCIICGGGFWNSKLHNDGSAAIKNYLRNNQDVTIFGYWGDARPHLIKEPLVNMMFCSSVDAVNKFQSLGICAEYAPHPIETELFYADNSINEIYDWCFIGTNYGTTRQKHLDCLFNLPFRYIVRGQGHNPPVNNSTFEQTANIFRQSKIILNINDEMYSHLSMYFSDRILMGMACNKMMLTTYCKDLEQVFQRGYHLDWYENEDELLDKMKFYIQNDNIRNQIAYDGWRMAQHYSIKKMLPYFYNKSFEHKGLRFKGII